MTRLQRRAKGEEGGTMVEFALISVLVFMCFFALVDISLVEIGNTAASNAVRAGARVAALRPESADVEGSTNYNAVRAAVVKRLAGVVTLDPSFDLDGVDVTCIDGTDGVTPRAAGCVGSSTPLVPERDRIRVTIRWVHRGVSPFVARKTKSESATVTVVGSGSVPVSPTGCRITSSSTNLRYPSIGNATTSGPLSGTLTVNVSTNGECTAGVHAAVFTGTETTTVAGPDGSPQIVPTKVAMTAVVSSATSSFTATFPGALTWKLGEKTIRFTNGQDHPTEIVFSAVNTRVTVVSNIACAIVAAGSNPPTNTPPSVRLQNPLTPEDNPNGTSILRTTAPASTIAIWAIGTTACASSVHTTFTPGLAGSAKHVVGSGGAAVAAGGTCGGATAPSAGNCYTWAISTLYPNEQWSLGLKTFTFDNGGTDASLVAWPGAVAAVQVNKAPPACTISVAFYSDSGYTTVLNPVTVDEKGTQGLGRLKVNIYVQVTQEFGSECLNPIYMQFDRGRGFTASVAPAPCRMDRVTSTDRHRLRVYQGETNASGASTLVCTTTSGNNKVWLPSGNVTFRFWNGDPAFVSTQQLTPLTPAAIPIVEQNSA